MSSSGGIRVRPRNRSTILTARFLILFVGSSSELRKPMTLVVVWLIWPRESSSFVRSRRKCPRIYGQDWIAVKNFRIHPDCRSPIRNVSLIAIAPEAISRAVTSPHAHPMHPLLRNIGARSLASCRGKGNPERKILENTRRTRTDSHEIRVGSRGHSQFL